MSRSVVAAMTAYTLELREAEFKLNQNESPFDFPREMKERVLERMAERPWNLYPDFESTALRTAIARAHALEPENILVGNGSNELLAAAIGAFVGPGTPVVFPRPTFALYEKLVIIAGGLPIPIDFDPDSGLLPLDAMLFAIGKHQDSVAIVCSPNNPTGGVLPDGGLDALLDSGAMVLLDEAYADFLCASVVRGFHHRDTEKNLVTFRTFSKAWGLAALRVGWLASTAENCREIRKVKLPYSLNVISSAIAEEALEHPEIRDRNVERIVAERERVFAAMQQIPQIRAFPSRANFIAFRTERPLFDALWSKGILIRDFSKFLRVSIGTREQNDAFLAALKEVV
ncbi:MAG: aminotransferase class I/II-fold pyridoxal phosphate-dependent enzyme [Acidobacteriota bacterium]|nr:aminotransferase class I/II-fold pyridoxal phosphate-dependent enzyme [Acidobacteriota bacterium]